MVPTRRWVLGSLGLSFVAGCSGPEVGVADSTPLTPRTTATTTPSSTEVAELDLREANVTGVTAEREAESVSFDVTLVHDDDGEEGYANWWQVERLDGTRVGRRELVHPHGTREFTRSDRFEVSREVTCVVVRGHDETHGYGGQAALVNLESGAVRLVAQGTDPRRFDPSACP
jgi:hypothetical protein